MGKKERYTTRANGYKETTKTYTHFGTADYSGKKHFYGRSDEDIDKKIKQFEDSLNLGPDAYKKKMKDLVEEWWEQKEPKLSPNTVQGFKTKKNEVIRRFGEIPVDELTANQVLSWLNTIAAQGYSQHSISDRKSIIKNILDYALAENLIEQNPCINLPVVKGEPKKKRKPASDEDIALIEAHKTDSLIARLFYFLEYSGCRIGEAAVLQEKDIDRENQKAFIYKDLAYNGNIPMVKPTPKTAAGKREIDLYDNVIEILPQYPDPETFIFFPDGLPHRSRLQRMQEKFKADIGITCTPHQLRHTYASVLHSAEIDVKDAQVRLGHSNIAVTQDIYTEVEKAYNKKVRNKANDYILNERLKRGKKKCPNCGSTYLKADDGHEFRFCPDCGSEVV